MNLPTRSYNHLELVIGFFTGEIMCYEVFSRTHKIFLKPATVTLLFCLFVFWLCFVIFLQFFFFLKIFSQHQEWPFQR